MQPKFPVRNIPADNLPIFEQPSLPEETYLLAIINTYVEAYGCKIPAGYRIPLARLSAGGNFQPNTYSLAGNGFNQEIPVNKVVPGYVYTTSPNDIRVASSADQTTFAKFLILAKDSNVTGNYLVQSSGIYSFTNGHEYVVGKDYYLGENGLPTTERPDTNAQKLFTVLDKTTIMIDFQNLADKPAQEGKGNQANKDQQGV